MAKARKKQRIKSVVYRTAPRGIDRIIVFRFFHLLHGRFWGIGAILSVLVGATIGYAIRPDLLAIDIPLSKLGTDVRTAPFFAGSMFLAAYCLWRWRIYLQRTVKNKKPLIPLVSASFLGLYMIALMPVTWQVWPARLHHIGVFITGMSMLLTVVFDSVLSKYRRSKRQYMWRLIKYISMLLILSGGTLVALSFESVGVLQVILLGEAIMYAGYATWVILKVVHGEGNQSAIGRLVQKIFYT